MSNVGADLCVGHHGVVEQTGKGEGAGKKGEHIGSPLPRIVQWFKTMITNEYIRTVKQSGWSPFHRRLWQRNYYEHIIQDEKSLQDIREYIVNNPLQWKLDRENPNATALP